jgi:peroxiredoxin family protein
MKQFAIAIDSDSILMALFAAIVAALAWAMGHAAALAEENCQFV